MKVSLSVSASATLDLLLLSCQAPGTSSTEDILPSLAEEARDQVDVHLWAASLRGIHDVPYGAAGAGPTGP